MPTIHVIAGPNGVGKTTFADIYRPFFDSWRIFDNDGMAPRLMALEKNGRLAIRDPKQFEAITAEAGINL